MQKSILLTSVVGLFSLLAPQADAKDALKITVDGISDGQAIPARYAHCAANASEKSGQGEDISPAVSWTAGPIGTKSYALILVDDDVPTSFDDAGQEGKTIKADMKRQDFYHWVVVNIPVTTTSIKEGKGKDSSIGLQGINDYPKFMGLTVKPAEFQGYNGPCPPWNDERVHHYHFQVYALDVESMKLEAGFSGEDAMKAVRRHAITHGEMVGTYTLNPALQAK